jgi:phosphate transport system substrate-binding protein
VVVVDRENPFDCITLAQLAEIWGDDPVSSWSEVTGFGSAFDAEIERFGPAMGSRSYDYFTDAIGEEGVQTPAYNENDDEGAIPRSVAGREGAIGYLELSSYERHPGRVKVLQVENENGRCVEPTVPGVQGGAYEPLGRPLYVYAAYDEARSQPVSSFLAHYVEHVNKIARELGFITLTHREARAGEQTVSRITGGTGGGP